MRRDAYPFITQANPRPERVPVWFIVLMVAGAGYILLHLALAIDAGRLTDRECGPEGPVACEVSR